MATRKDLLKAQGFVHQRLVRALVDRAPDGVTSPLRRVVMGTFASIMVGVLAVAVFGIIGWIHPGSTSKWKVDKTVVVDASSGGVFVYLEGKLYQTYNITSAKLATGGGKVVSVTSQSLKGFPREGWIGIKDAPRQLPATADMKGFPIRLCSAAPQSGSRRDVSLEIGEPVPIPASSPAVAVQDDSGAEYLILGGVAHRAPKPSKDARSPLLVDLGFRTVARPGNAFLLGLPQGSPLAAPAIPHLGKPSSQPVAGHNVVGTVFHVQGQVGSWYVLLDDGLAPINAIQARALVVDKHLPQAKIDPSTAAQAASRAQIGATDLPAALPDPNAATHPDTASMCATWTANGKPPLLSLGVDTPTVHQQAANPDLADAIVMPPVTGALLQPDTATDPHAAVALVTDSRRYGIADGQAQAAVGYADAPVIRVAPQLLNLIPQGLPAGQQLSIPGASPTGTN